MDITYQYGDETITLTATPETDGWRVRLPDGSEHLISARRLAEDVIEITEDARIFRLPFAGTDSEVALSVGGSSYTFRAAGEAKATTARRRPAGALTAPMGGVVAEVLVTLGQTVDAYQPLVVVEAMKVYATIEAPFAGTVKAVPVTRGQRVDLGELLVDLEQTS